ncbi:hypothetical protein ACIBSW_35400 [Actinoplanes sp. NPDC049668]|uniref:hypothetical protein n=1 Tax=unclassified Actinoplanes TaxID=2626549 RepID=UPI00339F2528
MIVRDIRMIDDRPVRFVMVPTVEDTFTFPTSVVLADRPSVSRHVAAVALGVFVALGSIGWLGNQLVSKHVAAWTPLAAFACAMALFVLCVVNWKFGSWWMYPVALALTLPVLIRVAPTPAVVAVVGLAGLGYATWRGDRARSRRWARTAPLLESHVRTDAVVTDLARDAGSGSSPTNRVEVTVAATGGSGLTWTFTTISQSPAGGFHPKVGDPMVVWYAPGDVAAAAVCAAQPLVNIASNRPVR